MRLCFSCAPASKVVRIFIFLIKECAMRTKLAILIFTSVFSLVACQAEAPSAKAPPKVTPSITGLSGLEADPTTTQSIRERMGIFLRVNPFTPFDSGDQLLLYLVSSGEFDQAEITLSNGVSYQGDILYAYALMTNQRVLAVPVLIGLQISSDHYLYFSENYAIETHGGITSTGIERQAALEDAQVRLPRGRIFRLLAYGMVTSCGLDWQKCPAGALYPPEICPVGDLVEQLYPEQTQAFVLRLSDGFPPNWLLVGWVFKEFTPVEMAPGTEIEIPLAGLSRP
jgi:hypothetical protein